MFGAMDSAPSAGSAAPATEIRWQWSRFPDLTPAELYAALAARQQVFTVEQRCAFQDADGHDFTPGISSRGEATAPRPSSRATCACSIPGRKFAEPSIGRVLTVPRIGGSDSGRR